MEALDTRIRCVQNIWANENARFMSTDIMRLTCSGFADRLAGTIKFARGVGVEMPTPVVTGAAPRSIRDIFVLYRPRTTRIERDLGTSAFID